MLLAIPIGNVSRYKDCKDVVGIKQCHFMSSIVSEKATEILRYNETETGYEMLDFSVVDSKEVQLVLSQLILLRGTKCERYALDEWSVHDPRRRWA